MADNLQSLLAAMADAFRRGDAAGARQAGQAALAIDPEQPDALHLLALQAMREDRREEGFALMRRSMCGAGAENPAYVANFARALARFATAAEAEPWLRRAACHDPQAADLAFSLAECLCTLGRDEEAEPLLHQVLAIDPNHRGASNRLGVLAQQAGRLEDAKGWFERVVRLAPELSVGWFNLGDSLLDLHRPLEAERAFRRAIQFDPQFVAAHVHLAYSLLMRGSFREGWREYLFRWKDPRPRPLTFVRSPKGTPWRGQALNGETLLLFAEQGFGDALQFVRYATLAAGRGARILLVCQSELADLMRLVPGVAEVVTAADLAERDIDYHAALMDLPHIFDTTMDTIPAPVPYVTAPAGRIAEWRARLGPGAGPSVALAWRSHPFQPTSPLKSCPLEALLPLFELPGVRFISLQTPLDPRDPPLPAGVLNLGGDLRDFADTAAILACVDHVVSIDTALAHLAGAMGRPASLLLCTSADWRWFLDRDDCPWYPSVTLFRQRAAGDWKPTVQRVRDRLAKLA